MMFEQESEEVREQAAWCLWVWSAASRMVTNDLHFLFMSSAGPFPGVWLPGSLLKNRGWQTERYCFWGQITDRLWLLVWVPSLAYLSGGRLSCCGKTLCRSPCDKGPGGLPMTCPGSLEMDLKSIWVFRWDNSSCSQTDCHLPKDPELKAPSWATPLIPDHRNRYKVIDIYCLKPLDFGVVSCFTIDNDLGKRHSR